VTFLFVNQISREPLNGSAPNSQFVCLLATLRKNFGTDLHEIFREGWSWAIEQMTTFSCRSRTDSPDDGIDITTLVRRALAEVCTVPVLLVLLWVHLSASLTPSTVILITSFCTVHFSFFIDFS